MLLDFWLMLLCLMFISSYTTTYFLVKKFIFPNVHIPVNTIFECIHMFLVEKGAINFVLTQLFGDGRGSSKMRAATCRGRGCHSSCVRTHFSFHIFGKSNNIQWKKKRTEMTKKYLESLRLNISNCYYKKGKHHLHLQQEESWRL